MDTQLATFGGGCFWGVEENLQRIPGVIDAISGYAGGTTDNPTYKTVCTGLTAHAEVVQVEFNPDKINYEELLRKFMKMYDYSRRNYNNLNRKSQYRTIVLYHNAEQKAIAEKVFAEIAQTNNREVLTELSALDAFTKAEEYHQDYNGYGRVPS
jgi:peptide-methionine (S)-S-oxide reductase